MATYQTVYNVYVRDYIVRILNMIQLHKKDQPIKAGDDFVLKIVSIQDSCLSTNDWHAILDAFACGHVRDIVKQIRLHFPLRIKEEMCVRIGYGGLSRAYVLQWEWLALATGNRNVYRWFICESRFGRGNFVHYHGNENFTKAVFEEQDTKFLNVILGNHECSATARYLAAPICDHGVTDLDPKNLMRLLLKLCDSVGESFMTHCFSNQLQVYTKTKQFDAFVTVLQGIPDGIVYRVSTRIADLYPAQPTAFYKQILQHRPELFDARHMTKKEFAVMVGRVNKGTLALLLDSRKVSSPDFIHKAAESDHFVMDVVLQRLHYPRIVCVVASDNGGWYSTSFKRWIRTMEWNPNGVSKRTRRITTKNIECLLQHGYTVTHHSAATFFENTINSEYRRYECVHMNNEEIMQMIQMILAHGQDPRCWMEGLQTFYITGSTRRPHETPKDISAAHRVANALVDAIVDFYMMRDGIYTPANVFKAIKEYRYITNLSNKTKLELPLELCSKIEGHLFRLNTHHDKGRQWDAFQRELWSHGDKIKKDDQETFIEDKYRALCWAPTKKDWGYLKKRTREDSPARREDADEEQLELDEADARRKRQKT